MRPEPTPTPSDAAPSEPAPASTTKVSDAKAPGARPRRSNGNPLAPIRPGNFGEPEARHLLWRAGFGGTPSQIRLLAEWGPEKSVDYILNYEKVAFESPKEDTFDKDIMRPPTGEERALYQQARRAQNEDVLAQIRRARQERERDDRRQMRDIQRWWLRRMIETPRPLEEKMTLFWHGHFATSYRTIENSYHMYLQNQFLRKHALGNFGDLLFGIIRDPAMLAYLDNNDSRKGKANENLARELMELFSLGIGNYGEQDIKEGARALTGYTFEDDQFVFQRANHDSGQKTILGVRDNLDGDGFVRAILAHRATAWFIPRKLYHAFVADLPPMERGDDEGINPEARSAIRSMGDTLLANRYEIKPVLRRLFLSEHFYSPEVMGQQIKSPVQLVVGATRSLGTPVRDWNIVADALELMGQNVFYPPSVKGWDGGRSWINTSSLFIRQNTMVFLITGRKPHGYDATADTQPYDPLELLSELRSKDSGAARNPERVAQELLTLALGHAPSLATHTLVEFFQANGGRVDQANVTGALLLISAMPEYQLC